ncbi:MAG: benzoylformate decarboxylase [Actinomycetota bacterium]|nr:benzoylformate decarboxylase [Actinomycetota bacterium]
MSTVREVTYELLRSFGMTRMFGNPGSTELPFLQGFPEDFTYVLGLHESAVVGMADGYAQGTGRAAFVNLHTAAGLGNAGAAIMTAYHNRTPLVITAGQQDRRQLAYEPFLSGHLVEMALPYVKWSHQPVRAEDVPAAVERAYHTAMQAPQGPVFVSVPMNDWDVEAEPREVREIDYRMAPSPEALDKAARLLKSSRRPAMVAGAGVDRAGAWYDTVTLAERLNAAVWTDPMHPRAGFPQDHHLFQGHLPLSQAPIADQLSEYDVVLVLGAPVFRYFPYVPGPPVREDTQVIHVTDNPEEASRAAAGTGIMGDVALAVRQLNERLPKKADCPAPPPPDEVPAPEPEGSLPADYVMHALSQHLPERAIVVEETPSSRMLLHKHIRINQPGGFYAAASGGLGFGTSASIGLSMASPDRPVVCVVGDGSIMYALQALWSAARYQVAAVFVVLNNRQYKILRLIAERDDVGEGVPGLDLPDLDILQAAKSLGCEGERVERPEELSDALERTLGTGHPYVLEILVDPDVPKSIE